MEFLKQKSIATDRIVADFFSVYGLYGLFFTKPFPKKILMLKKIKNSGFEIELDGDNFIVTPSEKLTDQQREFLKTNKTKIMAELLLTTVYNLNGVPMQIQAKDAQHKAWLIEHNRTAGEL